jgi:6-phosphogluconolactonase (cycloisomerase 2 family)
MRNLRRAWAGSALAALLAACSGGGGGGGSLPAAPTGLAYMDGRAIYLVGVPIDANPATVTGSVTSFSITPPLPMGLRLDPQTGELSGTPTASAPLADYTVTASNAGGSTDALLQLEIAAPPRFLLTASSADSTISSYAVDARTGELSQHTFAAAASGENGPEGLCLHPSGRFLYVTNAATDNISVYRMDPATGWLSAGTPVATGVGPHVMAIHPNGAFAYVASRTSNELHVYAIDALSGELTLVGAPLSVGPAPASMAIDPTGKHLFLGNVDFPRRLMIYDVNPLTGALTSTVPPFVLNGGNPVALSIDREGEFALVVLENYNAVVCLQIDAATGALSLASPGGTQDAPTSISIHPSGEFTYVTSMSGDSVTGFRIDRDTGALTPLPTSSPVSLPENAIFDPSGRYLYVLSRAARDVMTFLVDDETGALTLQSRIPARRIPTAMVMVQGDTPVVRSTRYAYAANAQSDDVSTFSVDPLTGVLSEIGLAALTGDQPGAVAVDPLGRFVFVANELDGTISTYSADAFTGALVEIGPALAVGNEPAALAMDLSGRFLYSVQRADDTLGVLRVDQTTGALTQIASLPVPDGLKRPEHVGIDPTGQYMYVAAAGDGTADTGGIAVLAIDPRTGVPARSAAPVLLAGLTRLGFHPKAAFVYGVLADSDEIASFDVNRITGALTEVLPRVSDGDLPSALAIEPRGRFAYAAFEDPASTGHVSLCPIDAATGRLIAPTLRYVGGTRPTDLRVDATGNFLFAANADSNDVSTFRIDQQSGELAPPSSTLTGLDPSSLELSNAIQ